MTFVVCLAASTRVLAQTVRVEPVISYEYGYPLTIERAPGIINHFNTSGNGSSYSHTIGFGASLKIPDLLTDGMGIAPSIEYRFSFGKFTSQQYKSSEIDENLFPVATGNHFEVNSTLQSIDLSLPVEFSIGKVGIGVGPWTSIELSKNLTGTEYIDTPSNARFAGGTTSEKFARGDTISSTSIHAGLEASLFFRLSLSNTLAFEPKVYGRVDLGALKDVSSKAYSVGLSFSLVPIPQPEPIKQVKIDTVITRIDTAKPKLFSEIHFTKNGIRTSSHVPIDVVGYNTYWKQYTEVYPFILFEPGSTALDKKYVQLSASEASSFNYSALTRADINEYSRQTLNIIGYRLTKDTSSVILRSLAMRGNGKEFAEAQLDSLRNYFINVWGIPSERLRTEVAPHPPQRGLYEPIYVQGEVANAPVPTQWIERSYHIPHMGVEKAIIADAGLRSWDVRVSQNEKILTRFSSTEVNDEASIADFDLAADSSTNDRTTNPSPLVAFLRATDFTGNTVTSCDTLFLPSRDEQQRNIIERECYRFVFLSGVPDPGYELKYTDLMIDKLFATIKKGAHIYIEQPPVSAPSSSQREQSVTERIVTQIYRHPELLAEVHIVPRTSETAMPEQYQYAVVVRIEQNK